MPLPSRSAAESDANAAAVRWRRFGKVALIAWFTCGMLLTVACVFSLAGAGGALGAFGWVSVWLQRLIGTGSIGIISVLGVVLAMVPMFAADTLRRRFGHPFFAGMKDGVSRLTEAPSVASLPDPRGTLLRRARVQLGLGLASAVLSVVVCLAVLHTTGRHQGEPLPVLDYAAAVAPGTALPPFAHLAGVAAQDGAAWVREYSFRSDRNRDIYTPLTPPGWQPGQAVALLALDDLLMHEDGTWPTPPAAPEGTLSRDAVPGWIVQQMRDAGLRVADEPVLLTRRRLGGVMPGPDAAEAIGPTIIGASFAIVFLLTAMANYRQRRRFAA